MKTETKTFKISYENLEAAVMQFLHSNRLVPLEWDITLFDMSVPVDEDGLISFDLEYVVPERKQNHLKLATKDGEQLTLFNV